MAGRFKQQGQDLGGQLLLFLAGESESSDAGRFDSALDGHDEQ